MKLQFEIQRENIKWDEMPQNYKKVHMYINHDNDDKVYEQWTDTPDIWFSYFRSEIICINFSDFYWIKKAQHVPILHGPIQTIGDAIIFWRNLHMYSDVDAHKCH